MSKQLYDNLEKFERIKDRTLFKNPYMIYEKKAMDLDYIRERLVSSSKEMIHTHEMTLSNIKRSNVFKDPKSILDKRRTNLAIQISKLDVLDPLLTIKRGYAVARTGGKVVSSANDLKKDDEVEIEFKDGIVNTRVL